MAWENTLDALGVYINAHTVRIAVPREKIIAIHGLMFEKCAPEQEKSDDEGRA